MVRAGRDIVGAGLAPGVTKISAVGGFNSRGNLIVHNNPNDISIVSAGRDIVFANFDIAGPGVLEVSAGRNLYQADKGSITSIGPIAIDDKRPGASILMQAGVGTNGPDYAALTTYLDPANLAVTGVPLADQAGKVAKTYEKELADWLKERFDFAGTVEEARTYFAVLAPEQQGSFLRQVYFAELKAGGREYNDRQSSRYGSYFRGRQAIATLFPERDEAGNVLQRAGDIIMFGGSGVRSNFGGDIQMLAPGGQIVVGVEGQVPPASAGVLTLGPGGIQMYSKGSILLGLSRIMATMGGDVLAWSAEGDINAGRGAKTTIGYVPPRRVYDDYGMVTLSPNAPSSGAGISARSVIPGIRSGDVDLIAPLGTIDIGEAGVSGRNVNLAALQIINAANIQAQGNVTGVPTVQAPPVAALSTSSNLTAATQQAQPIAPSTNDRPSIIIVEFLGFGGGDGTSPDGGEERRRRDQGRQSYDPTSSVQYVGVGQLTDDQLRKLTPEEQHRLARQ
ncbi:filamentous hemagglutinin family protein [Bradyrhizobium sp. Arg237L]|uniref:filamentous haemagglutinin family protein n=1 Tax=Bradyrhizobium sp. Arg237L TaxID=3003352 RepID=UPI00249E0D6C|nr:filamentous haemagglutinin family protein [Bradyrhizobium sp. Arg237L]MDI4232850.1 filamentous hemagglutinin family protein [Bradyrhizobium sp. Arg237L]